MKITFFSLVMLAAVTLKCEAQANGGTAPAQTQAMTNTATLTDCKRILDAYYELQMKSGKPDAKALQKSIDTLSAEGNWPDIDYADQTVSTWKPLNHLDRVLNLYKALRQPETPFFNDEMTRDAARRSLHWWLLHKPTESQWYHREISVPRAIRDIILLAGEDLTGAERDRAMKQLDQFQVGNVGANLIWSADLAFHDAALRGDGVRVGQMTQRLADEIKVSDGEGIQSDWSFHQHGARLQTFHYGGAYFSEATRIAWQLRQTQWAWPDEKIALLTGMALEGMRWQLRGNTTVPSTLDRSVARPGTLSVKTQSTLRRLAEIDTKRAAEIELFARAIEANEPAVLGFHLFPRSDFASYQTPKSSFFLKTLSNRTLVSESINRENLRGAQLNLGDHYVMRDGAEYFDLMGSWNWKQLPGVTWPAWAEIEWSGIALGQPYNGAATNGKSGIVAWQQVMQNREKTRDFAVRNSTFVHGNCVVSLWSDLKNSGADVGGSAGVQTTIEQSRWRGEVWVGTVASSEKLAEDGKAAAQKEGLTWANHNATGYIALQPQTLRVSAAPHSGNWRAISAQYSADTITDPLFTASTRPLAGQTAGGYAVLLDATPEQTRAAAAKPTWRVLIQSADIQAVRFDDGTVMAAFFAAGQIPGGWSADRACTLLFDGTQIWASDPLQTGGTLNLTAANGTKITLDLPREGSSISIAAKDFAGK